MGMTLRVLGNSTPTPTPESACSGYLVDAGGVWILLELGLAVWPRLLRYSNPETLDAVWISHLHPDHCADLFAAYQWAANTPTALRIRMYGPPGWVERIGAALPADDGADRIRRLFEVHEHGSDPVQLRDVTLAAVPMVHSVPAYGLRLTRGATLSYSGDSGPCDALSQLAAGSDLFLCEAGAAQPGNRYHCTPEDAAHAGAAAGRTLLTHLAPGLAPADASRRAGGLAVAHPDDLVEVG